MDRPNWLDEAAKTDWEKVKRDSIARRITQLSLLEPAFSIHTVKNSDKKKSDVIVFDSKIVRELWCKMITVIDELNTLKEYIAKNPVSKWEAGINVMEEFAGKSLIPKEEDIATIIQWHKDTFPRADFEGQVKKWEEEYSEFLTARTNNDAAEMLSELADLFIVACGIMRFNLIQGCQRMLLWNELRYTHGWAFSTCEGKINTKMKKNRARKWEYMGSGNYHHVKGVED